MGGEVVGRLEDFGRLAGAEGCARVLQHVLSLLRGRVRGSKHASRGPFRVLERRHGLAEIIERGAGVIKERRSVNRPHLEREHITLAENTLRHGHDFAQQHLGFFEAP